MICFKNNEVIQDLRQNGRSKIWATPPIALRKLRRLGRPLRNKDDPHHKIVGGSQFI
jgi:hypothetical protein